MAQLVSEPARQPTLPLAALGGLRYELLDRLGISEPTRLADRIRSLEPVAKEDLTYGVVDLAKAVLDRLIEQAAMGSPPTSVWVRGVRAAEAVGRTLMWTDHYLVEDRLATAVLEPSPDPDQLIEAISNAIELRPLVELGIVVPVIADLASAAVASAAHAATELDLNNDPLVAWMKDQVIVEGPTARQAILLRIRDEDAKTAQRFLLYGDLEAVKSEAGSLSLRSRLLGPYDPRFDYSEWIDQSKRQTAAALLQDLNLDLEIASGLGARLVTRTPFQARLLQRRGHSSAEPASALVWADVPVLKAAAPSALAAVAQEDETVDELRSIVRRAFGAMDAGTSDTDGRAVARGIAQELADGHARLTRAVRRERRWQLLAPAGLGLAGIAIGATAGGPIGAAAGLVGAIAGLAPYRATQLERRGDAAYALLVAERHRSR